MFPAETGGGQVKTNKNHSEQEHSTAQHTLLLGNALFDQTGPEPGGSSHPSPDEWRGPGGDNGGTPSPASKSVSFE